MEVSGRLRHVLACLDDVEDDSQYSSERLRKKISSHGIEPVIPYPANQHPKEKEFL